LISGVLAPDIDSVWIQVEPEIARVTDRFDTGERPEHFYQRLIKREQQLWLCNGGEGLFITEVKIFPEFKLLAVPIVAGKNMDKWMVGMVDTCKAFAKHHQCKYIEGYGRKGWLRALHKHGFKDYAITTRLEV
jgi:hypothetical protein